MADAKRDVAAVISRVHAAYSDLSKCSQSHDVDLENVWSTIERETVHCQTMAANALKEQRWNVALQYISLVSQILDEHLSGPRVLDDLAENQSHINLRLYELRAVSVSLVHQFESRRTTPHVPNSKPRTVRPQRRKGSPAQRDAADDHEPASSVVEYPSPPTLMKVHTTASSRLPKKPEVQTTARCQHRSYLLSSKVSTPALDSVIESSSIARAASAFTTKVSPVRGSTHDSSCSSRSPNLSYTPGRLSSASRNQEHDSAPGETSIRLRTPVARSETSDLRWGAESSAPSEKLSPINGPTGSSEASAAPVPSARKPTRFHAVDDPLFDNFSRDWRDFRRDKHVLQPAGPTERPEPELGQDDEDLDHEKEGETPASGSELFKQTILAREDPYDALAEVLDNGDIPFLQQYSVNLALRRIQRWFRQRRGRMEFKRRQEAVTRYTSYTLPRQDAAARICRSLRVFVDRRRMKRTMQRVQQAIDQRVEMENDPVLESRAKEEALGSMDSDELVAFADMRDEGSFLAPKLVVQRRGSMKDGPGVPIRYLMPFVTDSDTGKLEAIQQQMAARLVQRKWRLHCKRKLMEETDVRLLIKVVCAQAPVSELFVDPSHRRSHHRICSQPNLLAHGALPSQVSVEFERTEIDQFDDTYYGTEYTGISRRSSVYESEFRPLQSIKLSVLAEEQRKREAQERVRQQQQQALAREITKLHKEKLKKQLDALLLLQRVCRGYRRRILLYARRLNKNQQTDRGGGRVVGSPPSSPFLKNPGVGTTNAPTTAAMKDVHNHVMSLIAKKNPMLIPEIRQRVEAERDARAQLIQTLLRAKRSVNLVEWKQEERAAAMIQRKWKLLHRIVQWRRSSKANLREDR